MKIKILLVLYCLLLTGCSVISSKASDGIAPESPTAQPTMSTLPNPASAYCEEQGYKAELRTADDGSQAGFCVFPDGSECDEWAYFRGECRPASAEETDDPQGWELYTNPTLGYTFQYPHGAEISANDDPLKSLYVSGSVMGSESWTINHPSDRAEYRVPAGTDLSRWLADHSMACENPQPAVQIAGAAAIHCRHERSLQSYAADFYYVTDRGQLYQIIIGHAGDVEDWVLDERFLQSFTFVEPTARPSPAPLPTDVVIDPAAYHDWATYTHPVYNFTLRLPAEWIVDEVADAGPGMEGHILNLHPVDQYNKESIRLTFRLQGEDVLLWPTGVGQGEFVPQGTLLVDGEPALRMALVCPTSEVTSIWYFQSADQPNLVRGGLEFGSIYSATPTHCEAGYSLDGQSPLVGEMIVASLHVP